MCYYTHMIGYIDYNDRTYRYIEGDLWIISNSHYRDEGKCDRESIIIKELGNLNLI